MFTIEVNIEKVIELVKNNNNLQCKIKKSNKILYKDINCRLSSSLYKNTNDINNIINTINYVYDVIRSGILVIIKNNKLVIFQAFANPNFTNNWFNKIKLYRSNDLQEFINKRKNVFRYNKNYIPNIKNWWTNAFIINNEKTEDVWGTHSLMEYHNLLSDLLLNRNINDITFIINKRDHPILHNKCYEPYLKMFCNKYQLINNRFRNNNFIPILSPYSNNKYLDLPFIIPQDYQLAIADSTYYEIKQEDNIEWKDKKNIAFFRGSATGSMELKFNQRLQITKLSNEWSKSKPNLLNAGIVSWNSKDKIDSKCRINYIKPYEMKRMNIVLKEKIPMNKQLIYKYILNIDGHSKPNRTSYLLNCGSVMFIVESKFVIGNICWFDNVLKPYIHYIPIKYDFSDLEEKILWCRKNDDKCKNIVKNAKCLYSKIVTKDGIYDYCEYLFNSFKC